MTNNIIQFDGKFNDLEDIKQLIIGNYDDKLIRLDDVATVYFWKAEEKVSAWYNSSLQWTNLKNAVFIWISKKNGTNAVNVVESIKEKIEEIKDKLPKNYIISEVQNLWEKAKTATNMLIINLFQSIIIVLLILTAVLWFRNAINVAISIPLTLSVVFTYSLIM